MENTKLKELYQNVTQWAKEKGLDHQEAKDGLLKVCEETGEVCDAIISANQADMEDALGDLMVTVINFTNELPLDTLKILQLGLSEAEKHTFSSLQSMANHLSVSSFSAFKIVSNTQAISSMLMRNTKEEQSHLAEIKHRLQDIVMFASILAKLSELDILQCLTTAYNVISKRTGKMVNGVFVKSEDLKNGIDNQNN